MHARSMYQWTVFKSPAQLAADRAEHERHPLNAEGRPFLPPMRTTIVRGDSLTVRDGCLISSAESGLLNAVAAGSWSQLWRDD